MSNDIAVIFMLLICILIFSLLALGSINSKLNSRVEEVIEQNMLIIRQNEDLSFQLAKQLKPAKPKLHMTIVFGGGACAGLNFKKEK